MSLRDPLGQNTALCATFAYRNAIITAFGVFIRVQGCIGEGNQKYFIAFLFSQGIMCLYGAYIGLLAAMRLIRAERLLESKFRNPKTGEMYEASPSVIFFYFFTHYDILTFLTIFCIVMGFCVTIFAVYSLLIVRDGLTSYEKSKIPSVMSHNRQLFDDSRAILQNKQKPLKDRKEAEEILEKINRSVDVVTSMYKPDFRKNIAEMIAE